MAAEAPTAIIFPTTKLKRGIVRFGKIPLKKYTVRYSTVFVYFSTVLPTKNKTNMFPSKCKTPLCMNIAVAMLVYFPSASELELIP